MLADDTYMVIPACNVQSRQVELDHVADWAQANNLKLNRADRAYNNNTLIIMHFDHYFR